MLKLALVVVTGLSVGLSVVLSGDPIYSTRSASCGLLDYAKSAAWLATFQPGTEPRSRVIRTDGDFALHQTRHGQFWAPSRDSNVATVAEEAWSGEYGDGLSGKVVLDCGANVGVFTRYALERGAKTVVAIEIAPENVEALRRTFAGDRRVIVYPKGVWDREDTLTLTSYGKDSMGNTVALTPSQSTAGPVVPLTTIDSLVRELALPSVDFIKMDIEGSERKALRGAVETIHRFHPVLSVSIEHAPDDAEVIPEIIRGVWPETTITCGPCALVKTEYVKRLQPWVVYASR